MRKNLVFTNGLMAGFACIMLFTLGAHSANAGCHSPNLVAWWNFNGGTAEVLHGWTDASSSPPTSYGYDATGTVSPGAILFNGTGNYLDYGYHSELNLTSWTISATVKPTGFYSGSCQGNAIVYRGGMYSAEHYSLLFTDNAWEQANGWPTTALQCSATAHPTKNVFESAGPGNASFSGTDWCSPCTGSSLYGYLSTGTWYCVTASYNANTGTMDLYVNGSLVLSEAAGFTTAYNYIHNNMLRIGASNDLTNYAYYFNGYIDDIKIWDGPICNMTSMNCVTDPAAYATISTTDNMCSNLNPNTVNVAITGDPYSWVTIEVGGITPLTGQLPPTGTVTVPLTISSNATTTFSITAVTDASYNPGICEVCSATASSVIATASVTPTTVVNYDDAFSIATLPAGGSVGYSLYTNTNTWVANNTALDGDVLYTTYVGGPPANYHALPSTSYKIVINDIYYNNCDFSSSLYSYLANPVPKHSHTSGISNTGETNASISVSPSPNSGTFTLKGPIDENSADIEITDLLGKTVLTATATIENGQLNKTITLPKDVASGVYLIKINTNSTHDVIRFVLNK